MTSKQPPEQSLGQSPERPDRAGLTPDQKRFRGLIRGAAKLKKEAKNAAPETDVRDHEGADAPLDQRTEHLFGLFEERGFGQETTGISAASIANGLRDAVSLDDCMALLDSVSKRNTDTRLDDTLDMLDGRIDTLLQDPALRAHATTLLRQELSRYRRAQPTVKRVAKFERNLEVAAKLRAVIAAQAMREKGALIGSDAEAVAKLTTTERALRAGCDQSVTNADDRTLGFLNARTLLDYRMQLQEKSFAETPSRRALQEKIRTALAAGKKVLLAGATGTGKTQLAVYEVTLFSGKAEVASGHEAMTTGDLYGKKIISTDENGRVQTTFSRGPRARALETAGFVLDEMDTVNNRTTMRMKHEWSLKPGDEVSYQENGEETAVIFTHFAEVNTANLQSAKHPERVDIDPAVLRIFDSIEVGFMSASEVRDLMLANIMDPSGAIPLSKSEIQLLTRFAEAAEQTQKAYNGEPTVLRAAKGEGKDQLGKIFLDPGRVFTMMKEWPVAKATGTTLAAYLKTKLEDFLAKPEFKAAPDDRALLKEYFDTFQLLDASPAKPRRERPFTLPSELGFLTRVPKPQTDDLGLVDEPEGAAEQREVPAGQMGLKELQDWLKEQGLESKLEKPLEALVAHYEKSYAEGPLGFPLDRNALLFPKDPTSLSALKAALEAGSVNGVIITAYPTDADITTMAPKWAQYRADAQGEVPLDDLEDVPEMMTAEAAEAELLAMPITTFLARHFEARDGTVYEDGNKRVETWGTLRWEPNQSMLDAGFTSLPAVYNKAVDHESAYNLLTPQATLADVCGRTLLSFADTAQNPKVDTNLLQNVAPGTDAFIDAQGEELTFVRLMAAGAHITDPAEALALFAAADPKNKESYPDFIETWSHHAGITPSYAAIADSVSDGARLYWDDPGLSDVNGRARSVFRGTPGFAGLDPTARSAGGDLAATQRPQGVLDMQAARERMIASPGLLKLEMEVKKLGEQMWDGRDRFTVLQEIASSFNSLRDGPLGYEPDLMRLTFPTDSGTMRQLKEGIEKGVVTGMLLTAYPSEADIPRLVNALNAQEAKRVEEAKAAGATYAPRTHTIESLKAMPVTEFLARHFEARGGKFNDRDKRIKEWSTYRWVPNPLEAPTGSTTLSEVYNAGATHKDAYDDLKPQAALGEVLGTSTLSFSHTRREVTTDVEVLQSKASDPQKRVTQGSGLTFKKLMAAGGMPPNPVEWLTLLGRSSNPADVATYPTPYGFTGIENSWEWVGAIGPSNAAIAYSDSVGAFLRWNDPEYSSAYSRARSVFRGTPGL